MNKFKIVKILKDNAPLVLSAVAVAGTVSTAVLSAKGHLAATRKLELHHVEGRDMPGKERFLLTWDCYVPAVSVGTATIACIVAANTVSTARQVALASAYSLSENAFREYRDKVTQVHGANQEKKIRDEVAQDRVSNNPPPSSIVMKEEKQLCFENFTGRYFYSDMETIRRAQNDINSEILSASYASLNDFYQAIGLEPNALGEEVGWCLTNLLEVLFSATLTEKGEPCMVLNYRALPVRDYFRFGR